MFQNCAVLGVVLARARLEPIQNGNVALGRKEKDSNLCTILWKICLLLQRRRFSNVGNLTVTDFYTYRLSGITKYARPERMLKPAFGPGPAWPLGQFHFQFERQSAALAVFGYAVQRLIFSLHLRPTMATTPNLFHLEVSIIISECHSILFETHSS